MIDKNYANNESVFEGIFNTSNDVIITIDKLGHILSFNPSAEKILGYQAEEVIGKNVKMIMPALYYKEHDNYLANYLRTGVRKIIGSGREVEVKTKDGEIIPIHLSVSESFVEGEPIFVGIARDISELKEAQYQLVKSEEKTRAILETATDAIITIDQYGIIQYVNPVTKKMFQYDPEELFGKNITILMPFPFDSEHDSYLKRYLKTGTKRIIGFGREVEGLKKDGTVFPIDLSVSEFIIGDSRFYTGIIRDISSLHEAREKLKQSEERTRAVLETAADGIITIDSGGIIHSINSSAARMFGIEIPKYLGQNIKVLMPDSYANEHDEYLANYIRTGNKKVIGLGREVVGKREDGYTFPVHLSISEFKIGKERYFTGIVRDISDLKAAEEEIKRQNAELEQFAYVASHDLKSPLRNISNTVSMMSREIEKLGHQSLLDDSVYLKNCIKKMSTLIDDLLNLSKINNASFEFECVDLNTNIQELLDQMKITLDEADAELVVNDLPANVYVEPKILNLVFQNLIQNGIKFSKPGTKPLVEIGTKNNGSDYHCIYVKDNGIGIDEKYHRKIFEIFSRLHTDGEYQGTGIGLSIVKKIIDQHNGKISLESVKDQGTTFYIEIPK